MKKYKLVLHGIVEANDLDDVLAIATRAEELEREARAFITGQAG